MQGQITQQAIWLIMTLRVHDCSTETCYLNIQFQVMLWSHFCGIFWILVSKKFWPKPGHSGKAHPSFFSELNFTQPLARNSLWRKNPGLYPHFFYPIISIQVWFYPKVQVKIHFLVSIFFFVSKLYLAKLESDEKRKAVKLRLCLGKTPWCGPLHEQQVCTEECGMHCTLQYSPKCQGAHKQNIMKRSKKLLMVTRRMPLTKHGCQTHCYTANQ